MSTTTSENSPLQDQLVLGETLFITGSVLSLVAEIFATFRTLMIPNYLGTIVGVGFVLGAMIVANRLYTGKKEARPSAIAWIAAQIVIALVGMGLILASESRGSSLSPAWASSLAVPSVALGLFKAVAYGIFGYVLCQKTPAVLFLKHKGGEHVELPTAAAPVEDLTPSGVKLSLSPDQTQGIGALANALYFAGMALCIAGVLDGVFGLKQMRTPATTLQGGLQLGEGALLLFLGLLMFKPSDAVWNIAEQGADSTYVDDALGKLAALCDKKILIGVALAAITVAGLWLRLR